MSQEKNINEMTAEERRKYRKQLWQKRRARLAAQTSFFSLAALVLIFTLTMLFLLLFPRSTISQIEKRELAKFPKFTFSSYFSGEYTAGIANWFNDTVPYRDDFKRLGVHSFYTHDEYFGYYRKDGLLLSVYGIDYHYENIG